MELSKRKQVRVTGTAGATVDAIAVRAGCEIWIYGMCAIANNAAGTINVHEEGGAGTAAKETGAMSPAAYGGWVMPPLPANSACPEDDNPWLVIGAGKKAQVACVTVAPNILFIYRYYGPGAGDA